MRDRETREITESKFGCQVSGNRGPEPNIKTWDKFTRGNSKASKMNRHKSAIFHKSELSEKLLKTKKLRKELD